MADNSSAPPSALLTIHFNEDASIAEHVSDDISKFNAICDLGDLVK